MKLKGDRRLWIVAGVVAAGIACILTFNIFLSLRKDFRNLNVQRMELLLVKDEFLSLKNRMDAIEGKRSLSKVEGIVQAIDQVFLPLGLKQKVRSVKPTGTREIKDAIEEEAEIQVEKVDMNEMVNIFYKIENVPMVLSIKKSTIKTSFENSALLHITMTIALIKTK